jgi:dolichol-phosphate mannosyltransferase
VNPAAAPTGFTSLIVLILFIGGIQLLCLSVIGSYLAHIYEEVKRRPPYIVAEIVNRPIARPDHGAATQAPANEEGESSAVS